MKEDFPKKGALLRLRRMSDQYSVTMWSVPYHLEGSIAGELLGLVELGDVLTVLSDGTLGPNDEIFAHHPQWGPGFVASGLASSDDMMWESAT